MKKLNLLLAASFSLSASADQPNIVLIMADDMGWGQTGYYDHPVLKTPNLDAMAANGLRFDRFYAGASNCSPTRATVLTGRSNDRTGVFNHGYPLRLQEKTVAQALKGAGYATGHFGKWHLNGLRGPGVPVLGDDTHSPGAFGFETWLTVTNFFDLDPIMSRNGEFEEFKGDSSEVVVAEALKFIGQQVKAKKPSLSVIWYGTPHSPFRALEEDAAHFPDLNKDSKNQYGELVAMDRSIGTMRKGLRDLGIEKDTLVWFCSDNGGIPKITPETVGGLRGFKNSVYEGGIRVPAIIEWPGQVKPQITKFPGSTLDIFPTLADVVGLDSMKVMPHVIDGISLKPNFTEEIAKRDKPIPIRHDNRGVLIDNHLKVVTQDIEKGEFEMFDLEAEHSENTDVSEKFPEEKKRLVEAYQKWTASAEDSVAGEDYESGEVDSNQPPRIFWTEIEGYKPHFDEFETRPEYESWIKKAKAPPVTRKKK